MQFSSRRSHKKSRTGCDTCKQRHVKCDERRPVCENCTHRRMSCNYSWSKSEHHGSVSLAEGQHTTRAKADSTNGQDSNVSTPTPDLVVESSLIYSSLDSYLDPVALQFSIEDMRLLYFYTTSTSLTFAERPETAEIYSAVAPVVAFSEPGLLSSLLAVAALHRAHIEPEPENREKYFNIAASHQSRSIGILHELLTKIKPENCSAIFLTSSLIPIFTLAAESWLRQPCTDVAPTSSFDDVMNCVHLLRGVPSILSYGNHAVFDWIMEGPLRPLAESFLLKPVGQLGPEQEAQFAALHQALAGDEGIAEEELQFYLEALRILKEYAELVLDTRVQQQIEIVGLTLTWPTIVSEQYLEYLQARRPGALLLFARYAVLFSRLRGLWWARGWSQVLLKLSTTLLPEAWRFLIPELSFEAPRKVTR